MSVRARLYVALVTTSGLALVAIFAALEGPGLVRHGGASVWLLVAAVVIGELVPLKLGPGRGEVSPSTTFTFALLLCSGLGAAAIAQTLGSALTDLIDGKLPSRLAFNVAQYALAIAAAGAVLLATGVLPPQQGFDPRDVPAVLVAATVFFVVNTGLVAGAIALTSGTRLRDQVSSDLIRQSMTEGILLGLAPLAVIAIDASPLLLGLLVLPLVAVQRAGRQAILAERLSLHDALTGLPNRVLFRTRTDEALQAAEHAGLGAAVMLLDLDRFKEINDTLGHHYGDEVLRQVGERLGALVGEGDTVARLGGDEFAIVLRTVQTPADAVALGAAVRRAIAEPFDVAGVRLELGASVGIASFPVHGRDVDVLMQRADVAMYQAKEGRTGVERYVAELDGNSVQRLALASDLRGALEREEFVLHYQPKIDLRTDAVTGAEVLLRWAHPLHGWLAPDEFIPLAEQTGLIVPLTSYVLDRALREVGRWRAEGLELGVAVNLSARTLIERDLPDDIEAMCRRWEVPTSSLILEITEGMVVADPARALPNLARLHELGAEIAIDDFGTGYSSMDYLKRLPVSEVKIDRSFVTPMVTDARDAAIVRCTIDLARSLGLRVVAEGVETPDVRRHLTAMGCDQGQGFTYARALPAAQLRAWIAARERSQRPSAAIALSTPDALRTSTVATPAAAAVERGPATTTRS
jgi:diguanylate cyclase (GGDEF)-like protein